MSHIVKKIDEEKWDQAQKFELKFATNTMDSNDDWNFWWSEKFHHYEVLQDIFFENVLEVGCGPHTNLKYILPKIKFKKIFMEDPLIQYYIAHPLLDLKKGSGIKSFIKKSPQINYALELFSDLNLRVDLCSSKLEDLPYKDEEMNLVICINVLDHVHDYDSCVAEMTRVLCNDGLLILGQDLSNDDDLKNCPESYSDVGHPIKLDHQVIDESFSRDFIQVFKYILKREDGRNPAAHYGTYLGIFKRVNDRK